MRPAVGALVALTLLLLATGVAAQQDRVIETTEGSITLRPVADPSLAPFVDLFFDQNRARLTGAIFHEVDKVLACDEQTANCLSYDCSACDDMLDPRLLCEDGTDATCTCADLSAPGFLCTADAGAAMTCMDGSEATCSCTDLSTPGFECTNPLSIPPGARVQATDQTGPAGALHAGLFQLDENDQVIAIPNLIPPAMRSTPGTFQNNELTVAFVRDESCLLTSEWIVNLQDNSDVFDETSCGSTPDSAYLVFARVVIGSNVVRAIGNLPTVDLTQEISEFNPQTMVTTELSCIPPQPPSPLASWIPGVDDTFRCPPAGEVGGWNQFALFDFSVDPLPPVLGNCVPGDEVCLCPDGPPCVERALPLCYDRAPDPGQGVPRPCFQPLCDDTMEAPVDPMDPMSPVEVVCTEALEPNFPFVVPEPGAGLLATVALLALAGLRRASASEAVRGS